MTELIDPEGLYGPPTPFDEWPVWYDEAGVPHRLTEDGPVVDREMVDAISRTYEAQERCSACHMLIFLNHDSYERHEDGTYAHSDCRRPDGHTEM